MSVKNILIPTLWHFVFFVLGFVLFIFSFRTSLFDFISVFFYRGVIILVLVCFLIALIVFYFKRTKFGAFFTYKDVVMSVTLIFCINLAFFILIPASAERSISVFLLGQMNSHFEKAFTKEEIAQLLVDKYLYEHGSIEKRLHEQIYSGNIIYEGNKYRITKRGRLVMKIYDLVANIFLIDKKDISPH